MARQPFRPDIQGLRAIAVSLVVLYHAHLPLLSGGFVGVDVFYVISGFLITNHLASSLTRGELNFSEFYARRARRILPASFVVLLGTLLATVLFLPRLLWRATFEDAVGTAVYLPNVILALRNTDYLADTTPSVFQHYWSLGVEEQFYLLWPLALWLTFRLTGGSLRRVTIVVVAAVMLSLVACVLLTDRNQPYAFFLLPFRAWELGAGGLLALAIPRMTWRPGRVTATAGAWFGLALLAVAAFSYDDTTLFPGWAASVPVLGTCLLILFGDQANMGVRRGLSLAPMVFVGTISYSLYLVHWPVLVIPEQAGGTGRDLSPWASMLLVIACVLLAWALYRWVERPMQRAGFFAVRRPTVTLVAAGAASAGVAAVAVAAVVGFRFVPLDSGRDATPVGVHEDPSFTSFVPANLAPSLEEADSDNAEIYTNGCHAGFTETTPIGCKVGSPSADVKVALFGDSHAAQWYPALSRLADDGDLQLRVDTKSSCPSSDIPKFRDNAPYTQCDEWRANVVAELRRDPPDVVVITNYARSDGIRYGVDPADDWGSAVASTVAELAGVVERVIVLADTPQFPSIPATCLSAHLDEASACSLPRTEALDDGIAQAEKAAVLAAGGEYADLGSYFCDAATCGTIIGNRLIYRDANHITASMSEDLAPVLGRVLRLR